MITSLHYVILDFWHVTPGICLLSYFDATVDVDHTVNGIEEIGASYQKMPPKCLPIHYL